MKTLLSHTVGRYTVSLEWKLQDLWLGLFWDTSQEIGYKPFPAKGGVRLDALQMIEGTTIDVWICIVPCLPVHIHRNAFPD